MTDSAALSLADELGKLIDWLAEEGHDQENYDFLFTVQNELRSLQTEIQRLKAQCWGITRGRDVLKEQNAKLIKALRNRLAEAFIRGFEAGTERPDDAGDGDAMYQAFRNWYDDETIVT